MSTAATSFTATGVGAQLYVKHATNFTYSVSGTFVGTVILEKTRDAGISWQTITSATGSASGTILMEAPDAGGTVVRFRCSAFTSGTIVTSLSNQATSVENVREIRDDDGTLIFTLDEAGKLTLTGGLSVGGVINSVQGANIASATTVDLDAATGNVVDVTGTTTITGITLAQGRQRVVRFTGILTLTHGASLVLPLSANITTAAGDYAIFAGYGSSVVRCVHYQRLTGIANADVGTSAAIAYSKLNLGTSILNADVNASAAIAGSKISPDFGSQNITTIGTATVKAGSSATAISKVGGTLYRAAPATVGNVTTGETDLFTYTMPANVLASNGDTLEMETGGFLANTANTKTIKLYIGAQSVTIFAATTANVGFYIRHKFIRLSSTNVRSIGTLHVGTSTLAIADASVGSLDFTGTNVIKITAQSSAATDDVNAKFFFVKFDPTAP